MTRSWLQAVLLSLLSFVQLVVSECDGKFYPVLTSPQFPLPTLGTFDTDGLLGFPYPWTDDNRFTY